MINSKQYKAGLITLSVASAFTMVGCSTTHSGMIADVTNKTDVAIKSIPPAPTHPYSRTYDYPYVGSRIAEAAPSRNLPSVLTSPVPVTRLASERAMNISEFANYIQLIIGYPVTVSDDVVENKTDPGKFVLNFGAGPRNITMSQVMDMAFWSKGLNWEWKEDRIVVSKYQTKTWALKAPDPSTLDEDDSLPSGSTGVATTSSSSSSKKASATQSSFGTMIEKDIGQILGTGTSSSSAGGKSSEVKVNADASTVTVRATREQIDAVDKYIKEQNIRWSKNILVQFVIYTVKMNEKVGSGVDFQAVITSKSGAVRAITTGVSSVVPDGSAALKLAALGTSSTLPTTSSMGTSVDGWTGMKGSNFVLDALNSVGNVVGTSERTVKVRNMTKSPVFLVNNQTYVCKSTPPTVSNGQTIPGTAEQCTLSTGLKINLQPKAYDDNSMSVKYKLEISDASPLVAFNAGGTTLQNVSWTSTGTDQDAYVRTGEPIVIGTLKASNATKSSSYGVLSSSVGATESDTRLVIVMTAFPEH